MFYISSCICNLISHKKYHPLVPGATQLRFRPVQYALIFGRKILLDSQLYVYYCTQDKEPKQLRDRELRKLSIVILFGARRTTQNKNQGRKHFTHSSRSNYNQQHRELSINNLYHRIAHCTPKQKQMQQTPYPAKQDVQT